MWSVIFLLPLAGVALCRPAIETPFGNFSTDPLSPEDYAWLDKHTRTQRVTYPPGFHFLYVSQTGQIAKGQRPSSGTYIEVVGSPQTTESGLYKAALEVIKMMKHAPAHIFSNIANRAGSGLGVFTAQEKIVVFPEYAHLKDTPECQGRCDGTCRHTCTFDGRKYENLAGVTGSRAIVLIDNMLCTSHDPYHHRDNILVHEFAHVVHGKGMNHTEKTQVNTAFTNAKDNTLWAPHSYAMANKAEYFAEGTGAFFLVNLQYTTGGMTNCPGGHKCRTEAEVREFLKNHDIQLFNLLTHVYTNGDPTIISGLTICSSEQN